MKYLLKSGFFGKSITYVCLKVGVLNYTVIRNVVGKGVSGTNSGDLDMSMLENDYVIAFFLEDKTKTLVEKLKPVTKKFGGVCYISDAMAINAASAT